MKIYDVTLPISNQTPVYEGDPPVEVEAAHRIAKGDAANISDLHFGSHTGTHVDAPAHFIEGGNTVDKLDFEKLLGKCLVVELSDDAMAVETADCENLNGAERVLFKTRNSNFWNDLAQGFHKDFTYIAPDAARKLVELNVKLVGIDYLSVERFGSTDFATHKTLLENEVVIIEGLDLREVAAGEYELVCLPLKMVGGMGDGAPARTILRTLE
ncbi:MAG: cyclase family protein [Acidobacteriota bacterium]|nr:cyclase family protein [Acidobacteriota bacterium]